MPLIKNDESRPTGKKFLLPSLIRPEFDTLELHGENKFLQAYLQMSIQNPFVCRCAHTNTKHRHKQNKQIL